jgi:hypothetical protein
MVVSRRSGNRPPRWAARLQARVGSGSASPPPVAPTVLASALSVVPVWPGGPCVCWPTRRCCQVGRPLVGAIGPNFGGTPGRCRTVLGARPQAKVQHVPGGSCWWWRLATYRLRGSRTAPSRGRLTAPQDCEAAPHVSWRRAPMVSSDVPYGPSAAVTSGRCRGREIEPASGVRWPRKRSWCWPTQLAR